MQKGHLVTFLLSPLEKDELFLKIQIIDSYWGGGVVENNTAIPKTVNILAKPRKKASETQKSSKQVNYILMDIFQLFSIAHMVGFQF